MSRDPEEIRSEIEATREELADTAAALAYKTDVKARAQDKVDEVKASVAGKVSGAKESVAGTTPSSVGNAASSAGTTVKSNPVPTAAIVAGLVGLAVGYWIATRRG